MSPRVKQGQVRMCDISLIDIVIPVSNKQLIILGCWNCIWRFYLWLLMCSWEKL